MKRSLHFMGTVVAACLCWSLCLGAPATTTAPTTQPTTRQMPDAASLQTAGIKKAIGGHFRLGLELLSEAAELSPEDRTNAAAKALLQNYLKHLDDFEAQRALEYKEAVGRVEWCLVAQEYLPKLAAAKIDKPLRDKVKAIVSAYNQASAKADWALSAVKDACELRAQATRNNDKAADLRRQVAAVKTGPEDENGKALKEKQDRIAELEKEAKDAVGKANLLEKQAAERKSESLKVLDNTAAAMKEAEALLLSDNSDYAKAFRELSASAATGISELRRALNSSKAGDADEAERQLEALKAIEDKLAEALADVGAMVDEEPWRMALIQASIAKRLATQADNPTKQRWYRQLVSSAEARGNKAIAEARWYEALDAYSGLHDLEEDNEDYLRKVKTVRSHVRVVALYGGKAAREGAASRPVEEGEETWQDLVDRVDAEMVKSAISQLDLFYVSTVDYKKIARAALLNLKVLAETPQASQSFRGLADNEKKQKFIDAVAAETENIEKRDRVDHVDLLLAFNGVLRASERTVGIPAAVVAVEFTEGLLGELDKFSSMIWPHDVTDFQKNTMGRFHGVGIQITKEAGEPLKVITPLADSPALKAGIRAGDAIIAVDGVPTMKLNINKLIGMIMGEKGTKVVLTVERPGRPMPIDFEVIRDKIDIETVKGWRRDPGGRWRYLVDGEGEIAYIQLTQFTDKTPQEMADALADIKKELAAAHKDGPRSLVLDLRFNPGGLLKSAASVADEFLRTGLIVVTRGRQKGPEDIRADDNGAYLGGDLVVLVNEHSASAAEIVSGALKDWKRGIIVGGRTYGKGSVQNVIPIRRQQALLKLTTAYYYLPSGRLLHRENGQTEWGVDPDVEIKFTPRQTKRWLEIRRKTGLLLTDDLPKTLDENLKKQYDDDIQLQTAVLLLKLMKLQNARPAA